MQNLKHSALNKIVLIGASTGGPGHIEKIIKTLPPLKNTALVIAQHMAVGFMPSFTKRLQRDSMNSVILADDNVCFKEGNIYFCHGFSTIKSTADGFVFKVEFSSEYKYNPDINTIFNSFDIFTKKCDILAVILTGIGDDGVEACKRLSALGVKIITQDEKSAIVDGMPSRARKDIPAIEILDNEKIEKKIREFCS